MLQAIRVFVSSTFRDMHAERDYLNRFVFPRLRHLCEHRGVDFVAVDLRWGITREESEQHLAVDLCLREIERCRPFFLALIGDRYGWVPPPDHIAADAFERVRAHLVPADQTLLDQYYRVDRHLERPAARLNREADALDLATPRLVRLLQHVAGPDTGKSVTELEIERALAVDERAPAPRAFFYLREGAVHEDRRFPAEMVRVFRETDPAARTRLERLKRRLRHPATPGRACGYVTRYAGLRIDPIYLPPDLSPAERESLADGVVQPGEWQHLSAPLRAALQRHGTIALDGLEAWGERVVEDLVGAVDTLLAEQPVRLSARDETREPHERFIRERTRLFVGRADVLEHVLDFVGARDDDATLVVWGVAGSGKSTLLAQCVRRCREQHDHALVLPHFIGAAPGTTRLVGSLTSLCLALTAHLASDLRVASDPLELEGQLLSLLEQAGARGPVVLFIDALNQLDPSDGSHELRWLPARVPRGVRLVVSTLPGTCLERLRNRVPSHRHVELPALARDERDELVTRVLAQRGKRLSEPHRRLLLDVEARPDASLPLYLVVTLEELSLFGDFDGLERRIRALPEGLPALFDQVLERLELDHGRHATEHVLTRIAASRAGLLESEILDVLGSSQLATTPLWWSRLRLALDFYLQRVDSERERGTTDFFHEQLRTAVYRRYLTMESAQHAPSTTAQAVHRELADYFIVRARTGDTWQPNAARPLGELTYHLALGARLQALAKVLSEPAFLEAKLEAHPPAMLIEDFDRLLSHRDAPSAALDLKGLSWLRDAVRLAAHVLLGDPSQLRSQLWARLLPRRSPMTDTVRAELIDTATRPWLLAYATDLTPVGGTLRGTLAGMNCVNGVVTSPDDEIALCHDDDNVLWHWHLRTGTVWRQIELDRDQWIFESTRHPDKPIAYVGKQEGGVIEVDMEAAALTRTLPTPPDLEALCVTPDGTYLLTAHKLGKVACLSLSDTAVSHELDVGWDDVAALVAIDAHRVLVGVGSRVEEWDLTTETKIGTRHEHGSNVEVLALSADRRVLATGLADGSVELTNLSTGCPTRLRPETEVGERSAVKGLAFTPKGEQLLAAGPGNDLHVWDTATGELRLTLRGHSMGVYAVAAFADGQRAASVSKDGTLRIWDLAGEATLTPDVRHTAAIAALAVGPGFIVSGSREFCAWDLTSGRLHRRWPAHDGETIQRGWVGALAVTADGKRIVSAGSDGSYRTWDCASGERMASRRGSWGTHDHYALSPDGALVASHCSSGQLHQLEVRRTSSGRRIWRVDLGHPVSAIAIAPNRRQIAVADLDGGFDVVDVATGKVLWSHAVQSEDTSNYIESLCIGSSGRHAVLGFKHGQVAVWDLEGRRLLVTHALHTDRVRAVAISPDERLACSASWDRALKVWRLPSAEPVATFCSDDFWSACAFADDGVIVAGDQQGCVHFLRLQEPKLEVRERVLVRPRFPEGRGC